MRFIITSTYWPEYSGPAVRIKRLNEYFRNNVVIIAANRRNFGIRVRRDVFKTHNEYVIDYKFCYLIDFFISSLLFLFFPINSKVHSFGSSTQIHALFLISYIRRDLKIVIELVNYDSSPIIKILKGRIKIQPRVNSTLILALNKNQKTYSYRSLIKPNPISNQILNSEIKFKNKKYPLSNKKIIKLGFLSKFKYRKNQSYLIETLNKLPEKYVLYLAGPTDKSFDEEGKSNKVYLDNIYELVEKYKLKNRVVIYEGYIKSLKFFKEIDHFVIPSFNEGFGTSIVEAIALGLPVTCNKDEDSFLECSKLCPKTVFASSINNSNEFARDIINLDNSVTYSQLKISREKIINYCSEDKINKLYSSIFKTNQIF